jgi:DNA-binding XRE family transcriptional regulator
LAGGRQEVEPGKERLLGHKPAKKGKGKQTMANKAVPFADKLKDLRKRAGLTQAELAAASGLGLASIRNYEQGRRTPMWNLVFKLAGACGVGVGEFADCVDGPLSAAQYRTAAKAKGKT